MAAPDEAMRTGSETPAPSRPAPSEAELERRRGKPWRLEIVGAVDLNPRMRRIQLALLGDAAGEFLPRPGQEIVLQIPQPGGEAARRHYTIRRYDTMRKLIDVDFLLHGHRTPAVNWALAAAPGEVVDIRGPRGRIASDPAADWHLFLGDETCIPAIFALLESLPKAARAFVFIEIGTAEDKQEVATEADLSLQWILRDGAPPGPSNLLLDALTAFAFPPGKGRAIVIGETSNVRKQRHALLERGFQRGQIYAEGYWRPGRIGGHDHVED